MRPAVVVTGYSSRSWFLVVPASWFIFHGGSLFVVHVSCWFLVWWFLLHCSKWFHVPSSWFIMVSGACGSWFMVVLGSWFLEVPCSWWFLVPGYWWFMIHCGCCFLVSTGGAGNAVGPQVRSGASITHPNANIQHNLSHTTSKAKQMAKSHNDNCVLHRKINPNPTQYPKSKQRNAHFSFLYILHHYNILQYVFLFFSASSEVLPVFCANC